MSTPRSGGAISYAVSPGGALAARLAAREAGSAGPPKPRLLDRVREAVRARHYSRRTEKTYVGWVRRYILFHGKRHPVEMGAAEVTRFLTSLAVLHPDVHARPEPRTCRRAEPRRPATRRVTTSARRTDSMTDSDGYTRS
jgi:Phage integrase, N-terminal SAM-like domain